MKTGLILTFALFLGLAGCTSSSSKDDSAARKKSPYFDMFGFLAHLKANDKGHALKKTSFGDDGKLDQAILQNPDYVRELALFYSADIQKPAWQDEFNMTKQQGITTYSPKGEKTDLKLLVVYSDSLQNVTQIDVILKESNYLFSGDASGSMFLKTYNNKPRLDSLSIVGTQNVLFGAPFTYTIQGKLQ